MDRDFEEKVDELWCRLSPQLRGDIQRTIGFRREDVTAEALREYVLNYLGPKLQDLRLERRLTETSERIKREIIDELGHALRTALQQVAEMQAENIRTASPPVLGESHQIALPSLGAEPPRQPVLMLGTSYVMDCKYVAQGGPRNCLHVIDRPDGRYVQCERWELPL